MRVVEKTTPKAYPEIIEMLSDRDGQSSQFGGTRETIGVTVRSDDPRERIMFRPNINWAFGLQESFAYWNGINPGKVERYNPKMEEFMYSDRPSGRDRLHGSAYGRYFRHVPHDQIDRVIKSLKDDPDSRQEIINVHQSGVEDYDKGDVACTVYLHLMIRDGELNMIACLRSQDMLWGYPYDVQAFQWIQEVIAGILDVDLGWYEHRMNSCHYYIDREGEVLESAEMCTPQRLPDCRLNWNSLGNTMVQLRDGLTMACAGTIPRGEIALLEKQSDLYADWLRVMTAYEQANFHDRPEKAHDILGNIKIDTFATYVQRVL